jgi:hypothetical protein
MVGGDIARAFVDLMLEVLWWAGVKGGGGGASFTHSAMGPVVCTVEQADGAQGPIWIMPYRISRCAVRELKPGHPFRSLVIIDSGII